MILSRMIKSDLLRDLFSKARLPAIFKNRHNIRSDHFSREICIQQLTFATNQCIISHKRNNFHNELPNRCDLNVGLKHCTPHACHRCANNFKLSPLPNGKGIHDWDHFFDHLCATEGTCVVDSDEVTSHDHLTVCAL